MAIKGMTDQQAAFPIIGVLRKGEEKTTNAPGKDLDYFRFTSDDPQALEMFFDAYPDKPRQINVFLPHKTTDENMDSWIEKWVAGGLIYRSDGETVVLHRNDKGHYSTEPKPDPSPPIGDDGKRQDGSSQVGRLSIIIPELGRIATVTALTTSKWDIVKLTQQLRGYEALNGDLRGIPFVLKRRLDRISTPAKDGKRVRREKWLLSIETKPEWSMAKLLQSETSAYPQLPEETTSASSVIINQLPPGVIAPFDEPGQPEPEPRPEPITPDELKAKIKNFIAHLKDSELAAKYFDPETGDPLPAKLHPFGDKTPNLVAAKMTEALDGDKAAYKVVIEQLTGQTTATKITAAQAAALFKLLFNGSSGDLGFDLSVTGEARVNLLAVYNSSPLFDDEPEQ